MGIVRHIGTGGALVALALAAVPAAAGWDRGPHRHHRQPEKIKAGDLLIGAALVGLVAAIAAKKPKPAVVDGQYDPPPIDPSGASYDAGPVDPAAAAAVDGCVSYVGRNYADDDDRFVRVEEISSVEPTDKGFKVRGRVRIEEYAGGVRLAKFRCSVNRSGKARSLTVG